MAPTSKAMPRRPSNLRSCCSHGNVMNSHSILGSKWHDRDVPCSPLTRPVVLRAATCAARERWPIACRCYLCSALAILLVLSSLRGQAPDKEIEPQEVIQRAIKAHGGVDNLKRGAKYVA